MSDDARILAILIGAFVLLFMIPYAATAGVIGIFKTLVNPNYGSLKNYLIIGIGANGVIIASLMALMNKFGLLGLPEFDTRPIKPPLSFDGLERKHLQTPAFNWGLWVWCTLRICLLIAATMTGYETYQGTKQSTQAMKCPLNFLYLFVYTTFFLPECCVKYFRSQGFNGIYRSSVQRNTIQFALDDALELANQKINNHLDQMRISQAIEIDSLKYCSLSLHFRQASEEVVIGMLCRLPPTVWNDPKVSEIIAHRIHKIDLSFADSYATQQAQKVIKGKSKQKHPTLFSHSPNEEVLLWQKEIAEIYRFKTIERAEKSLKHLQDTLKSDSFVIENLVGNVHDQFFEQIWMIATRLTKADLLLSQIKRDIKQWPRQKGPSFTRMPETEEQSKWFKQKEYLFEQLPKTERWLKRLWSKLLEATDKRERFERTKLTKDFTALISQAESLRVKVLLSSGHIPISNMHTTLQQELSSLRLALRFFQQYGGEETICQTIQNTIKPLEKAENSLQADYNEKEIAKRDKALEAVTEAFELIDETKNHLTQGHVSGIPENAFQQAKSTLNSAQQDIHSHLQHFATYEDQEDPIIQSLQDVLHLIESAHGELEKRQSKYSRFEGLFEKAVSGQHNLPNWYINAVTKVPLAPIEQLKDLCFRLMIEEENNE